MITSILEILTREESCSTDRTQGSKGFLKLTILNLVLEPSLSSSFGMFISNKSLYFLVDSLAY